MDRTTNIICFIRGCAPRAKDDSYLVTTTMEQIRLTKQYGFPASWLIQHDAMQNGELVAFMKQELDSSHDVGIWFEVVQGLVEKAGLKWRGRFPWDWYPNVGFSIGYTPQEREKLVDVFMDDFKKIWGRYPESAGSWFIDAHTLAYMQKKYGITASCNCREQFGTDGYGIWGGYWSGAYYPSRKNSLLPGQTEGGQIPVPVFRMLGGDPIYQYASEVKPIQFYEGYGHSGRTQDIITLEPKPYHPDCGGGNPDWINWFFRNNFSEPYLSLAHAQVGQENSMSWDAMKDGLREQLRQLDVLRREGFMIVETLAESGRKFKREFPVTPPTAISALEDWKGEGRAAVWYMSLFQRLGFLVDEGRLYLRDWQLYNEDYPEPYLEDVCTETSCIYDALPLMDGFRWRKAGQAEGSLRTPFRPVPVPPSIGFRLETGTGKIESVKELPGKALQIKWCSNNETILITCEEDSIEYQFPSDATSIRMVYDDTASEGTELDISSDAVHYTHSGFSYKLNLECGSIDPQTKCFYPKNKRIKLRASIC